MGRTRARAIARAFWSSRLKRALAALVVLGALTHFIGLTHPREVVFDEAIMGPYMAAYCCTGQRVFDLHPPHPKLLVALSAKLGGFDGTFPFETIGKPYGDHPVFALRLVPALTGILIPPLFFLLLLELRGSFATALLGGLMLALDNAFILETRIIVWDGVLVASTLAALVCFFAAGRRTASRSRYVLVALAGALAGLAAGSKMTGLAALALMLGCLVMERTGAWGRRIDRLKYGAILVTLAALVYVAGWIAHFVLLTNPGPADSFYTTTGRWLDDFLAVHRSITRENINLSATHPDASAPWTWPWMKVAPYFWQGTHASIYLVGNPVVWWGSAVLFITALGTEALRRVGATPPLHAHRHPSPRLWVALAGYAIAFLPLLPVSRVLFLYHYLTPLTFSIAFVLLWLDRSGWTRPGLISTQRASYFLVVALLVVGFLAVSPLTYGFSAGGYDEWLAGFVRSWR